MKKRDNTPEEGDFFVKKYSRKNSSWKITDNNTATCVDADDENKTITANRIIIYLIVKRIGSVWQEI